jgi:hypothetical protein
VPVCPCGWTPAPAAAQSARQQTPAEQHRGKHQGVGSCSSTRCWATHHQLTTLLPCAPAACSCS